MVEFNLISLKDLGLIDVNKCRLQFAKAYRNSASAESNALNEWKLSIFKIIDLRISFYSNNLNFLPRKPKFSF